MVECERCFRSLHCVRSDDFAEYNSRVHSWCDIVNRIMWIGLLSTHLSDGLARGKAPITIEALKLMLFAYDGIDEVHKMSIGSYINGIKPIRI